MAEQRKTSFFLFSGAEEISWRGTGAAKGDRLNESFIIARKKKVFGLSAQRRRSFFFFFFCQRRRPLSLSPLKNSCSHGVPRSLALLQQRSLCLVLIVFLLGERKKEEQQCIPLLRCRRHA